MLGLEALLANLARKGTEIEVATEQGLVEAGNAIRQAWVDNIEAEGLILTAAYRDSIKVELDEGQIAVYTEVPYAGILEFGDSRQAAHPVAERAADEHHDDVSGTVGRHIEQVAR